MDDSEDESVYCFSLSIESGEIAQYFIEKYSEEIVMINDLNDEERDKIRLLVKDVDEVLKSVPIRQYEREHLNDINGLYVYFKSFYLVHRHHSSDYTTLEITPYDIDNRIVKTILSFID